MINRFRTFDYFPDLERGGLDMAIYSDKISKVVELGQFLE